MPALGCPKTRAKVLKKAEKLKLSAERGGAEFKAKPQSATRRALTGTDRIIFRPLDRCALV
jgi:hypothetical protein